MNYQNEIARIKEEMTQLKIKHAKDVEQNNQEEIQKNRQRVQDLIKRIEEIKALKLEEEKKMSTTNNIEASLNNNNNQTPIKSNTDINKNSSTINNSVSSSNVRNTTMERHDTSSNVGMAGQNNNPQRSFNNTTTTNEHLDYDANSSFSNNYAGKEEPKGKGYVTPKVLSTKTFHAGTFVMSLVLLIYSLICIFQRAIFLGTNALNQKGVITYNVIYLSHDFFKYTGMIILIIFILYVIFVRRIRFRIPIIFLGLIGLIGGFLSFNSDMVGKFFSGTGYGFFPGIILLICTILVMLNIKREPKKFL